MSAGTEAQTVESATTAIEYVPSPLLLHLLTLYRSAPDQKTRRYDRQLRLWAKSGQAALESAHILVLSSSSTSTSILKNLVLPGVGNFTILDNTITSPADAGNNFFLEGLDSVGKPRAAEAVRLLLELNEGVKGQAITDKSPEEILADPETLKGYTLIIAHNLDKPVLDRLSNLLWADVKSPPLVILRSAGFLAEVFIQFHEHASECSSSLFDSCPWG